MKKRDNLKLLNKRSVAKGTKRTLIVDGTKTLAIDKADREYLASFLEKTAKQMALPKALALIDAARRIAGTGSLGLARFVLLVEGDGSPNGNWLLDLKAAVPSAVAPYVAGAQPKWASEADRVVSIQTLFQANTPSLLSAHSDRGGSFLMKQLQPTADRLDLAAICSSSAAFDVVIDDMARLTAWGHLRGSGRKGAARGDELIAAVGDAKAARAILERAEALAKINAADWAQYNAAYDKGGMNVP